MQNYSRKTQKEILKRQLEIQGQSDDFKEIIKDGFWQDIIIDDSLANTLRLMLFATGSEEEEELMIILTHTREKLRRMLAERS